MSNDIDFRDRVLLPDEIVSAPERVKAAEELLKVVTFNAWVGQAFGPLIKNLVRLIAKLRKPHVIVLQEVWRHDLEDAIKGYTGYTGRPDQTRDDTYRSTVVLVRDDGEVRRSTSWSSGANWTWNGNSKAARVFVRVTVRFPRIGVVDIIGGHLIPGGPKPSIDLNEVGWRRDLDMLEHKVKGILDRHPRRLLVLAMDWNAGWGEMAAYSHSLKSFAKRIGAREGIIHIDGVMVVNGAVESVRRLKRKFGSDGHRPVVARIRRIV